MKRIGFVLLLAGLAAGSVATAPQAHAEGATIVRGGRQVSQPAPGAVTLDGGATVVRGGRQLTR